MWRCRSRCRVDGGGHEGLDVFLGDDALGAGADDIVDVDAIVLGEFAHGWLGFDFAVFGTARAA